MQVAEVATAHPAAYEEGFCEVGEQEREAGTGGLTAQAKCGGEPAEGDEGMGKDGGDESDERGEEAFALKVIGGSRFDALFRAEVSEGAVWRIDGGD